jgi:hypothetical protein
MIAATNHSAGADPHGREAASSRSGSAAPISEEGSDA